MPVITLTTEWKANDFYYGIIKGKLCTLCPGIPVVDNATGIPVFNIAHASFVIRNTYRNYPEGSVHLICVHSEKAEDKQHLIVRAHGHYFIGTDNGIFNLILNSPADEIISLRPGENEDELDLFARAASEILAGKAFSELGNKQKDFNEKVPYRATIDKNVIIGSVIFIDSYGNAITNITREVFSRVFEKNNFRILIQSNKHFTEHISNRYSDEPVGDLLARFNSLELLELAINGANISELLSLSVGSSVRVDNTDSKTSPDKLF